jgi:glycosyltransferase involved in cell wall biosynthesis
MRISVVVPCYNESAVLPQLHERLLAVLTSLAPDNFEIIYVDDGSDDETPAQLYQLSLRDPRLKILRLSRNFGQEAAMTAGLAEAAGDAVVIIDADLQDPPELIAQMHARWREGWQIVFAEREDRAGEGKFKRWAAQTFYCLLRGLSPSISHHAGNFRLLDRAVVDAFLQMPERTRFVRGMISWVGFKQIAIPYRRAARFAGKSKYPLRKMFSLATDAITSFSFAPLRLATILGLGILVVALVVLIVSLVSHPINAILLAVLFLGGAQLLSIGILGEYIGRTYTETKRRPLFVVHERYGAAYKRAAVPDVDKDVPA